MAKQPQRSCWYLSPNVPWNEAIEWGIEWLGMLGEQDPPRKNALLAVRAYNTIDQDPPQVLNPAALSALQKGKVVTIPPDIQLSALTENNRKGLAYWNGSVLALYPTAKLLERIDNLNGVTDVLVIPFGDYEDVVVPWIEKWEAQELKVQQAGQQVAEGDG